TVASDVTNTLLGDKGASYIFGPQKGADKVMLAQLERGMVHYAALVKRDLAVDVTDLVGAGAAGGLGAEFFSFLKEIIKRVIDYMIQLTELEKVIALADLVLTGEGKIDDQTLQGKVPYGVARLGKKHKVPIIAIVGANEVRSDDIYQAGISAIFSIANRSISLDEALRDGESLTSQLAENVFRLFTESLSLMDKTK